MAKSFGSPSTLFRNASKHRSHNHCDHKIWARCLVCASTSQREAPKGYTGTALVARGNGRYNGLIFLAPSEHYYRALLPDVESALSSAQLT